MTLTPAMSEMPERLDGPGTPETSEISASARVPPTRSALVLPAELTIYTVGELHPKWVSWLGEMNLPDAEGFAELQAGAVDQVDAAGLQLLLSLEHALAAMGRHHCITDASRALVAGCAGLGLSGWLQAQTQQGCTQEAHT